MNLYRIETLVNEYKSYDWKSNTVGSSMNDKFSADRRLKKEWQTTKVIVMTDSAKLSTPSFGSMNWIDGWLVSPEGAEFLLQFKDCCELLPVHGPDKATDNFLVHFFSFDLFPAGHDHSSPIGDFHSAANEPECFEHAICRDRIHRDDGKAVPGVYQFCTDEFKEMYEEAGLTGLEFHHYWPMEDRIEILAEKIKSRAAAAERGKMMSGNSGGASVMPKGKVGKAAITWKKNAQPTPEQLATYLWQSVIDQRMTGKWLGDAVACNTPDAEGSITDLAAQAVTHLLNAGVDKNVLCHLARSICFESISAAFNTLEETGIDWEANKPDWQALKIALVQQATIDKHGHIGGWPAK